MSTILLLGIVVGNGIVNKALGRQQMHLSVLDVVDTNFHATIYNVN